MRYVVKGGVWKNTEDEILKAAVMKYGINQWARISSLLVRKSAKQCKARWYEWLDPSIKKTEWSREEEEKLLHLAKLMPNQWRSIAPMVGRTAAQCLEHYEKLLDAAQGKDGTYDPADDPRRLRPGEIDPNPEVKPARPDPVDMDEDEKEMLQEARARLANTRGKKAKRKAREKQLDEARRLAALQKRRELKAAGLAGGSLRRVRKGQIDYNKEIPFMKQPPKGFHDVSSERKRHVDTPQLIKSTLAKLEGKRRLDEEQRQQRMDVKRQKIKEAKNLPEAVMQVNKLNDPAQIRHKSKLQLPAPQVQDHELEEIAKYGRAPMVEEDEGTVTSSLLPTYSATPTPARASGHGGMATPVRTPMQRDTLKMEAENLIAMTSASTPLLGGANPVLHDTSFAGALPERQAVSTPNPFATPAGLRGGSVTPQRSDDGHSAPSRTPLRDGLSINDDVAGNARDTGGSRQVKFALANLPQPKNTYKVVIESEDTDDGAIDFGDKGTSEEVRDAAEIEAELAAERKKLEDYHERMRSSVLRKNLPRPTVIPSEASADSLVAAEVRAMMIHDCIEHPFKRGPRPDPLTGYDYYDLHEDDVKAARAEIEKEMGTGSTISEAAALRDVAERVSERLQFNATKKRVVETQLSKPEQCATKELQFNTLLAHMVKEHKRIGKQEKKADVYTRGHVNRASAAARCIQEAANDVEVARTELECYKRLRAREERALEMRRDDLKHIVSQQSERERDLQEKYAKLLVRLRELTV